jgi:hypothetical protein
LTLALATLGWVNLPPGVTEPLIALTILWVGLDNIRRGGTEPAGRWAVTLLFGLVHGFGFAAVLRDLGVGTDGRALLVPLLAFNQGVELGQLGFAAIVLPLLWWLRRFPWFVKRGVPILSGVAAFAGFYWLVERILMEQFH